MRSTSSQDIVIGLVFKRLILKLWFLGGSGGCFCKAQVCKILYSSTHYTLSCFDANEFYLIDLLWHKISTAYTYSSARRVERITLLVCVVGLRPASLACCEVDPIVTAC